MNYDLDTLVSIKSSFQGNQFQWIKTNEKNKLGKLVSVRDIIPARNGRFVAILSDGTQLDTDRVSSDLMMIQDEQPPLTMAEVQSLNYVPSLSEGLNISPDISQEIAKDFEFIEKPIVRQPNPPYLENNQIQNPGEIIQTNQENLKFDLFGMFEVEDTELTIQVNVKIPSKSLLKMMYSNSKDKTVFLDKLAKYINSSITIDSIKSTLSSMLANAKKKKIDADFEIN